MSYTNHSIELCEPTHEEPLTDATMSSLLDAYSDHAYQDGYARATRDLLAVYPLLIEQYLHRNQIESAELRRAIRGFGMFIEETVDRRLADSGFVDEGLGI
jgi:hypothetical protein